MSRLISVSDITIKLNDAALPFRKKIELAKLFDRLGVSVIEVGPVRNPKSDLLLIKSLASAVREAVLAVPVDPFDPSDAELVWGALREASHPRLQVSVPVSTVRMEYECHRKPAVMLQTVADSVKACTALCPDVELVAEDFGRSEDDFLMSVLKTAAESGATTISVRDDAGTLLPDEFFVAVKRVRDAIPSDVKLGVWCSNEMYMADSCAVVAISAGADEIKTLSQGNSTTSLKRFVRILNSRSDSLNASCGVRVTDMQRAMAQVKMLCEEKPGSSLASLSGLSAGDGEIVLTVHDDKDSVLKAVSGLGYDLSDEDADRVYDTFVRLAALNGEVEAKELNAIVASVAFQAPATYRLDSYVINSGNTISATCHLRLRKDDTLLESLSVGDGPVDAAFVAIEKLLDRQYELDDFQIQSVTEGRAAMGEAVVRLRHDGKLFSGRGISTDIIGSSIMAYLNAVNKIVYEEDNA